MLIDRILRTLSFPLKIRTGKANLTPKRQKQYSRIQNFAYCLHAASMLLACALFTEQSRAGILIGQSYYTNAVASSEYSNDWVVTNLFDNDLDVGWAIAGSAGNNPQGQRQGWVSFTLDQTYSIVNVLYASRNPSTDTMDRTDTLKIWISTTSFGVNVQSASETNNFLTTATGLAPTLTLSNFDSTLQTFSTGGAITGKYVLAQFITTDTDVNSNLGGRDFLLDVQSNPVPEPTSMAIFAMAGLGAIALKHRRRSQAKP